MASAEPLPPLPEFLVANSISVEPLLGDDGKRSLLNLALRLAEGIGAALAAGIVKATVRLHGGTAMFAEAGVSGPGKKHGRCATRPLESADGDGAQMI